MGHEVPTKVQDRLKGFLGPDRAAQNCSSALGTGILGAMELTELTLVVYARDFDLTVQFYGGLLGLQQLGSWDRDESKGVRFSVRPGAVIEVWGAPGSGIDQNTRVSGVSLALEVTGVDQWHARLRAAGLECTDIADEWWGGRTFYTFDPNGLTVLLSEVKVQT